MNIKKKILFFIYILKKLKFREKKNIKIKKKINYLI
jgi:hypothetical protein